MRIVYGMSKPKLLIFASGTREDGGSGFENLVQASRDDTLSAEIVGIVSNYENGGVRERADRLGVPFIYFGGPFEAEHYRRVVKDSGAEWVILSGWLKFVKGLDPAHTFNIHPALLSFDHGRFGGTGMYSRHIHEAVADALEKGEITESGCSMHFTTEEYDRGPIFFEYRVSLKKGMMPDDIAKLVHQAEHLWQPKITNMVVHGDIRWDGKDPHTLVVPKDYTFLPNHDALA